MNDEYEKLLKKRIETVYNVTDWIWIAQDNGAWDGPKTDFENSHREKILRHVKNFKVVIQAGGNQGMYPRLLSDMFESVYTFEPDPLNFHCLVNNCQRDNVYKFNAALGAEHAMIRVNRNVPDNTGMNTVTEDSSAHVFQMKIDDLSCLNNCDLIWLDIEGYEYNAIRGGIELIKKFKPTVMLERPNNEVIELLTSEGYYPRENSISDVIFAV